MSDAIRVFISAVSAELGDARRAVRDTLTTKEVLPIVQDNFPPDHRAVRDILRSAIAKCDAVVCLVGQHYGREPKQRAVDEPRRSYTQLEYETAIELQKPVFLFAYRGDGPDDAKAEPDELQRLQLSYLHRLSESDQIRLPFASEQELREQVALIDFTPDGLRSGIHRTTAVLLHASIDGAVASEGNDEWVTNAAQPWLQQVASVRSEFSGDVYDERAGTCVLRFANSEAACNAALSLQQRVENELPDVRCRVAIHSGEIIQFRGVSLSNALNVSHASGVCQSLSELCSPGQILLTRAAFDEARQTVRTHPDPSTGDPLEWVSHGRFLIKATDADDEAVDESIEVCEVGLTVTRPTDTATIISTDSVEQERMRGWRPSIGQPVPNRESWVIQKKLGEGGFGEVWLARNSGTKQQRVFKFCFDADRLRSFRRELTLFRLLREALGDRNDIARLLEVQLEQAPFFLESEYVEAGNLIEWAESQGGLASIPLDERLRIMREICSAVATAHSVGVFHRDLKPSNIFMRHDADGTWHPMLADFGIGAIADRALLDQHNITHASFMEPILIGSGKGSGTRMYKPPEAESGDQRGTTQADVYALGVILYQLSIADFTRPAGIGWDDAFTNVAEASAGDDIRASKLTKLKDDIRSAVHARPANRLGSASELEGRLIQLDSRATESLQLALFLKAKARNRRLLAALAASALIGLLILAAAFVSYRQYERAEAAREMAERRTEEAEDARRTSKQNEIAALRAENEAKRYVKELENEQALLNKSLKIGFKLLRGLETGTYSTIDDVYNDLARGKFELSESESEAVHHLYLALAKYHSALDSLDSQENSSNATAVAGLVSAMNDLNRSLEANQNIGTTRLLRAQVMTHAYTLLPASRLIYSESRIGEEWNEAVRLLPQSSPAHSGRGYWRIAHGETEAGAADLRKAIDIDCGNVLAHRGLAALLLEEREWQTSFQHFRQAVSGEPKYGADDDYADEIATVFWDGLWDLANGFRDDEDFASAAACLRYAGLIAHRESRRRHWHAMVHQVTENPRIAREYLAAEFGDWPADRQDSKVVDQVVQTVARFVLNEPTDEAVVSSLLDSLDALAAEEPENGCEIDADFPYCLDNAVSLIQSRENNDELQQLSRRLHKIVARRATAKDDFIFEREDPDDIPQLAAIRVQHLILANQVKAAAVTAHRMAAFSRSVDADPGRSALFAARALAAVAASYGVDDADLSSLKEVGAKCVEAAIAEGKLSESDRESDEFKIFSRLR